MQFSYASLFYFLRFCRFWLFRVRQNFQRLTKKIANYYPDFLCIFKDKSGKQRKEIIEIKPKSQTLIESAKTKNDKEALALNYYKWAAATKFAKDNGMTFRVLNEDDIFGKTK